MNRAKASAKGWEKRITLFFFLSKVSNSAVSVNFLVRF